MQTQTVIRAVDYVPTQPEIAEGSPEEVETNGVVVAIFGAAPDYSQPEFEQLWQEVFDGDDQETIAYCLSKNIDVLDDDKKPVSEWRDIAVMLKAIDKGLISVA